MISSSAPGMLAFKPAGRLDRGRRSDPSHEDARGCRRLGIEAVLEAPHQLQCGDSGPPDIDLVAAPVRSLEHGAGHWRVRVTIRQGPAKPSGIGGLPGGLEQSCGHRRHLNGSGEVGRLTPRAVRAVNAGESFPDHRTKRAVRRAEPLHPDAPGVDGSGNPLGNDAVIAVTFPPLQFSRGTGQRGVDRG